jgi:nicotinate phosphoribosyltransferase
MVATNAARLVAAAGGRPVVDFSPRRNHGIDAALRTARAARIGGAAATSLVAAGQWYDIELSGTMAHSFVMRVGDERDAFRIFARAFPGRAVILLDTYDTTQAARTLVELTPVLIAENATPRAVRIDSGDLDSLSRAVRAILDAGGLESVQIFASGNLDEHRIAGLVEAGTPIDGFGIGTHLLVNEGAVSLDAAYKLVQDVTGAKLKLSAGKESLPGRKQVHRVTRAGRYHHDVLVLAGEVVPASRPLLAPVMTGGRRAVPAKPDLGMARCRAALDALPERLRALDPPPPPYEVRLSSELRALRDRLRAARADY